MEKVKKTSGALVNWFTLKRPRHNRALRDILDLVKSIEGFCARYRLQDELADFRTVFASIGQARLDATELTYRIGLGTRKARNIESRELPLLLEEVYNDFEEMKRALYTRTLSGSTLRQKVLRLDMSFENLLAEVSKIEYQ